MDREEYLESVTLNTGIKMNPVESSNIEGIGYDNKNKYLWVAFKGNKVYRYDLVPRKIFEELMNAESKGDILILISKDNMKLQDMNSKTKHIIFPFSILGVTLLGFTIANTNSTRRVTPPYVKESREDSIRNVKRYEESKRRDSIFFAKVDSIKKLKDSLSNRRLYRYAFLVRVTPDNIIFTARKSGYQQVTLDAHYTKPRVYYQVFTSDKPLSPEEASAYAEKYEHDPSKVTILTVEQYNQRYGKSSSISEYDIFTEGLDSYYDDPENLDENPDEIFDFLLD